MIKRPVYAIFSLILLAIVVVYVFNRLAFLKRAEHTTGTVTEVKSSNGQCRRSKHSKYPCTKYRAYVEFFARNGSKYIMQVSAGNARDHDQSIENADLKTNDEVPVVYDPESPRTSYEDAFWGVWGGPFMLFIFQIGSFFTSLCEPRRKKVTAS